MEARKSALFVCSSYTTNRSSKGSCQSACLVAVRRFSCSTEDPKVVLLPIVPVVIRANNKVVNTFALLDPGSEVTMLSSWVKEKLELTGPAESAVIGTWHAQDPSFKSTRIEFEVSSENGNAAFQVKGAYTVPSLNLTKRPVTRDKLVKKWPHLADVPLRHVETAEVTLLIGNDHGDMLEIYKYVKDSLKPNAPKGILTPFGWTVTGNVWPAMCDEENPISCRLSLSATMDAVSRLGCYSATVSSLSSASSFDELVVAVSRAGDLWIGFDCTCTSQQGGGTLASYVGRVSQVPA